MRSRWFGLVVAFLAVALSIWAHPQLPPTVATHWNLNGTPDGYSSRAWALSIIPIVLVAMTVVFNVLPKIDPRHENYARFLSSYWLIANAIIVFLLGGFVLASGAFLPHGAFLPLFVVTILFMPLIPIVQSYVLWKREQHDRA